MSESAGSEIRQQPVPQRDVCIVLIHGIGDIRQGTIVRSAEKAIRAGFPQFANSGDSVSRASSGAYIETLVLRREDVRIEISEFNWTGIAGKIRLWRPLQALWRIMQTIREAPNLAVDEKSPAFVRFLAQYAGWYQSVLVGLAAVLFPLSLYEVLVRPLPTAPGLEPLQLWGQGYPAFAALVALYFAAAILSTPLFWYAFVILPLRLIRFIIRRPPPWQVPGFTRTLLASAYLSILVLLLPVAGIGAGTVAVPRALHSGDYTLLLGGVLMMIALAAGAVHSGNLLRDVVHYLHAAPGRKSRDGMEMRRELQSLIIGILARPAPPRLVLVSHSLGTVILMDLLLNELRDVPGDSCIAVDVVTAGSPIRRLINRLLPARLPGTAELCDRLRAGARVKVDRWFNVYRVFDFVGQALTYSALLRIARRDDGAGTVAIREHLLRPLLDWRVGHSNYWEDERFVAYLAQEVIAPLVSGPPRSKY
jgi:hypothetical protein